MRESNTPYRLYCCTSYTLFYCTEGVVHPFQPRSRCHAAMPSLSSFLGALCLSALLVNRGRVAFMEGAFRVKSSLRRSGNATISQWQQTAGLVPYGIPQASTYTGPLYISDWQLWCSRPDDYCSALAWNRWDQQTSNCSYFEHSYLRGRGRCREDSSGAQVLSSSCNGIAKLVNTQNSLVNKYVRTSALTQISRVLKVQKVVTQCESMATIFKLEEYCSDEPKEKIYEALLRFYLRHLISL
jgi:hypothetical protein